MTKTAHLLVVDDDRDIRALVAEQLEAAGYQVSVAADGDRMRAILAHNTIDLIVLDLNLPGIDGLTLCREVQAKSAIPIIMLTARREEVDRVLGLEMGADDYLTKPFAPRELLARIRSVLRRTRALLANLELPEAQRARFAGWTFDLVQRQLIDPQGRTVILSGAEFRLLKVLVERHNRVLSREQLLALGAVRQGEDRAIDLQVSRLRSKLGDDPKAPTLIKTIRSEGYIFTPAVDLT